MGCVNTKSKDKDGKTGTKIISRNSPLKSQILEKRRTLDSQEKPPPEDPSVNKSKSQQEDNRTHQES